MKNKLILMLGIVLLVLVSCGSVSALSYTSQYPPTQSGTYVKVTTTLTSYEGYYATDPAKSLTGNSESVSWLSAYEQTTDQRFHIDLGEAKYIRRIYYENFHDSGGLTERGIENFTFWGSNTPESFAELTYANDTGWTQLTTSQSTFDRHADPSDAPDPKYITVANSMEYRYYSFKIADNYGHALYVGVRRIELQTEDGWVSAVPSIIANATTPDPALPDQDWQINITATDPNNATFTAWCQFYINDVINGSEISQAISNDTNTRIANLSAAFIEDGYKLTAEVWVGDGETNSTRTNITSTVSITTAPNQPTLNSPVNDSLNSTIDAVNLSVTVTDDDGDNMNVTFYLRNIIPGVVTSVSLNSPNGGEIWSGTHPITWSCVGEENDLFVIYGTGGSPGSPSSTTIIDTNINCSDGTYVWDTATIGDRNDYQIVLKVCKDAGCDYGTKGIEDYSDGFFTINNTSPTGASVNQNYNVANGSVVTYEWSDLADGIYEWYVVVTDGIKTNTSDVWTFSIDHAAPTITSELGLNKTYIYENNLTSQINFSDMNLYSINITFNNSAIFGITNLDQSLYVYNLSQNISSYSVGTYNVTARACDGHTTLSLKDEWDYNIGLSGLTFKDGKKWYRINPTNNDLFESIRTTKLTDRYTFEYSKSAMGRLLSGDTYTFVVESSEHIDIISRPNSRYNAWLVIPTIGSTGRWIDFNLKDIVDAKYTVKRLNDKQVEVTITNVPKDIKELVFESTGELNCVTEYYEFYVYDYTLTHNLIVLETSSQTFTLNITKDSNFITDANATLHWNGTAYNTTKTTTSTYFLFSKTLTMPSITTNINITFNWTYTLVGNVNETNRTSDYSQQIYKIDFDDCSIYSIVSLNFSLIEESNNASIAGDMDFTFSLISEGININYSKSVTEVNSTAFCISHNNISFTAQLQSEYTANSYDGFTYFAYNLAVSSTTQYITYYLTNGTTIVEFTVLDQSGNKLENAYIKVMKYDIGTGLYKTIEVLKTDELGKALGNIVLDTAWYKFMVEYQGTLYLDTSATKLTSTTRTFTINLLSDFFDRFTDVIYNIYSTLNYTDATGNFAFTYSDPNGNYHRGCLLVTKESLGGQTLIEEKCVESTAATILIEIHPPGSSVNGTYTAVGYIMFDDMYVLRTISRTWGHLSEVYGKEGLFYVFLIVLTCVMVAVFSPKLAIILAVIGLVFSNILGFYYSNAGWMVVLIIAAGLTMYRMRDQ